MAELDERARNEKAEELGLQTLEGQSLHSTLRRGWYWGSQQFRERMLERFGEPVAARMEKNRTARSSQQSRDFAESGAEKLLREGKNFFGLKKAEIDKPARGDRRRVAIAWAIWTRTSGVSQDWIAQRLNLRSAPNVSQQIRLFSKIPTGRLPKEIRKWRQFVTNS